jgi:hypothetical protein
MLGRCNALNKRIGKIVESFFMHGSIIGIEHMLLNMPCTDIRFYSMLQLIEATSCFP